MLNIGKLISFVSLNLGELKDLGTDVKEWVEDGTEIYNAIVAIWKKYNVEARPTMGAAELAVDISEADAMELVSSHPVLLQLMNECTECDSVEAVTEMKGPGTVVAIVKALVQYGPTILSIINALKK